MISKMIYFIHAIRLKIRIHISSVTKCVTKFLTLSKSPHCDSVKKVCDTLCDTRNMDPKSICILGVISILNPSTSLRKLELELTFRWDGSLYMLFHRKIRDCKTC